MISKSVASRDRRGGSRIAIGCVLLLASATAHAEPPVAPSQVTPSDFRPARNGSAGIDLPAAPGLIPPPNAANLAITLSGFVVEGGFPELADQTRAITDSVVGRRTTLADIYAAASALEGAYGAAGYALVRVVVPPQKLDPHGRLRIVVVDGYIESVDVKGVPERQRGVVAARLAPLVGQRHVKLTEIERRVLLASDVPGLGLKSTLAAGAASGGARLVVEGPDRLVTGLLGVDNNLPRALGSWEYSGAAQVNSPFGYGEQFYLSATTGYDLGRLVDGSNPIQIFGAGFIAPIGIDGLTINPEYTNAITRPAKAPGAPAVTGYFQRADLRASYPVIRTRRETLTLFGALEWDQEYMRPNGFPTDIYSDQYFVWRGKADSLTSLTGGAGVEAAGALSQGLGGRTGVNSAVPLSQQGASPYFTKFNADARWTQPLPEMFNLTLYGSGQTSFGKPLMVSEQLSLDGPGAVSGYPTGTFVVDEGAFGRAELGRTFSAPVYGKPLLIEPYVFGAAAIGFIDLPTAVQQGTLHVGSFGVGARTSFNPASVVSGTDLWVEVARYVSDVPGEREGWRGNLAFSVRF